MVPSRLRCGTSGWPTCRPAWAPRAVAAAALLLLVAAASPVGASRWDPAFRWNTLRTPHFAIHFHQGETAMAIEMARVAEEVHAVLSPWLEWEPAGRTQVVLVDPTDSANGYATTVPYNAIVVYAVQPTSDSSLDNHENWLYAVFIHEYTHVLQIDMIGGLPRVARFLLGRLIVPNAVLPRWMTEGIAVYAETRFTAGGRGRSTYTDMLLRTAALEGRWPPLDTAEGYGQAWPQGQLRYLFGGRFHFEVERRAEGGSRAWTEFHRRHGRYVIPWLLPAKRSFGTTLSRMWRDWKAGMASASLADAERIARQGRGLSATRVLPTRPGMAWTPSFAPDGASVLYLHSSPRERSSLRIASRDGSLDRRVYTGSASSPVWGSDGGTIWWTALGQTTTYESFHDLYSHDLETGTTRRWTLGARLADPAPHPGGNWLVAVRTFRGQSQLVRVDLPPGDDGEDGPRRTRRQRKERDAPDPAAGGAVPLPEEVAWPPALAGDHGTGAPPPSPQAEGTEDVAWVRPERRATVTPITAAEDGSQYSSPAWDPAGERLAVSIWKPGGFRDIHVLGRDGRLLLTLTWDRALDADPAWTPDGEHLLFVSDRDGVLDVFACRLRDGAFFRVTRLLTGARHPAVSPDGRTLVFQAYTASGWRLEEMPLDPARWEPYAVPARALPDASGGPSLQAREPLDRLEGVPGPVLPSWDGPAAAVARARARPDFRTLAESPQPIDGPVRPGPREHPEIPPGLGRVRRYNPLPTLLPPRYLGVFGALTDTGALGGVSTGGTDALGQHAWAADVHYRTDSRFVGWSAGYVLDAWHPRLSVGFSSIALDYGRIWRRNPEPDGPGGTMIEGVWSGLDRYYERRDRLSAGLSIPIRRRHALIARYKLEFRRPLRDPPADADPELLPARGSFSGLVLGWTFGEYRSYPASISPEDSRRLSVSVDLESSYLGAWRVQPDGSRLDLHRAIFSAEGRQYVTLPWGRNHVLAMRLAAGATLGTDVPQRTFRIGGAYGDNPYVSLPDRYYALRGYPTSSMRGNHVWVGAVEYRLPLFYVERGAWTVPVWLRSVALTVFAEAGQAFDSEDYAPFRGSPAGFVAFWAATRPSVGVELVGDAVLGWGGWFQGRVGYGLGLGPGAASSGTFYAQIGTSF